MKQGSETSNKLIHGLLSQPQVKEFSGLFVIEAFGQISLLEIPLESFPSNGLFSHSFYNLHFFPPQGCFSLQLKNSQPCFQVMVIFVQLKIFVHLINHASGASSYSPSKCGGLILQNYPCNSTLRLFEVCCSDALSERSSFSPDLSGDR